MSTSVKIAQKDKRWLITGASSGFGRLLTEYLCQLGARVFATARNIDTIEDLATKYPGNVVTHALDVTSQHSIDKAVADAISHVDHIDVLVNNAGYGVTGAIEEVTEAEYMPMFETNVFGMINLTKALLPQFRERRSGMIVNFSSIGGLIGARMGLLQRDQIRSRRAVRGAERRVGAVRRARDGCRAGTVPHGVPGTFRR